MELNKKEIIYELAKGVQSQIKAQSYGAMRRKLHDKQGVSEIALYSAVAEHLEENDIEPTKFVPEMAKLLKDISDNLFVIKTDDDYSFLRRSFSAISYENSPESTGHFLCNRCFTTKSDSERAKGANYKNSCDHCFKEEAKISSKRYAEKIKEKKAGKKSELETVIEQTTNAIASNPPSPFSIAQEHAQEPPLIETATQPVQTKEFEMPPYIQIDALSGDASETIISLSCETKNLSKLLVLIDPYILIKENKNEQKSESEPESESKSEPKSEPKSKAELDWELELATRPD